MTTVQSSARSTLYRPLKAIAVAALLLGTTAMLEPTPVQAGFGGILNHAMRVYGGHYGGGGHRSRGSRHSRREGSRHEGSRHASRHHRGEGRSRETRNEEAAPAAQPVAQERKASAKANDGMDLTPSR